MDISLLNKTGFALSNITIGKSMRPLIWGGQHFVAITPLDGEPAIGDILVFSASPTADKKTYIVHRLVEIKHHGTESLYITRGDNCLATETVDRHAIIGRVAEVHRTSGYRPWHAISARQFSVTDRAYLRYTRFWTAIWPARRIYYRLRGHARGLRNRLLSLFKKR